MEGCVRRVFCLGECGTKVCVEGACVERVYVERWVYLR